MTTTRTTSPYATFLDACEADAAAHAGLVSVNRVRASLLAAGLMPEPHAFSGFWSSATGTGRPMVAVGRIECQGSRTRNNGKLYFARRWVGAAA